MSQSNTTDSDREQLEFVLNCIDKCNARVWVDDGSLIGLYRDGHLLESDPDIDLGALYDDVEDARSVAKRFESEGYQMKEYKYNKKETTFSFIPVDINHNRHVSISIYHLDEDYAYCPAYTTPNPYSLSMRYLLTGIPNQLQAWYLNIYERLFGYVPVSSFFIRLNADVKVWKVPKEYYQSLKEIKVDTLRMLVPMETEQYLSFRYGSWKEPDPNWNYWVDDPALVRENPEKYF